MLKKNIYRVSFSGVIHIGMCEMFKEKELKSSHPCICLKLDWNKVENTLLQTVIVIYYVESKNHPKRI